MRLKLIPAAWVLSQWTMLVLILLSFQRATTAAESNDDFTPLFDGQTLKGWSYVPRIKAPGHYLATNRVIVCPTNTWGVLMSEKEYSDFVLRLDYKLEAGGNNGVLVRTTLLSTNKMDSGVEIQMLDDKAPKHERLKPYQYNGSVYGIVPAHDGAPKIGEWNTEEITCIGQHYKVVLNGRVIVDADLTDPQYAENFKSHPGAHHLRGHLGFMGHGDYFEFRNIRIKEIGEK
jgi:3-keto-disaccharide hydrolase